MIDRRCVFSLLNPSSPPVLFLLCCCLQMEGIKRGGRGARRRMGEAGLCREGGGGGPTTARSHIHPVLSLSAPLSFLLGTSFPRPLPTHTHPAPRSAPSARPRTMTSVSASLFPRYFLWIPLLSSLSPLPSPSSLALPSPALCPHPPAPSARLPSRLPACLPAYVNECLTIVSTSFVSCNGGRCSVFGMRGE